MTGKSSGVDKRGDEKTLLKYGQGRTKVAQLRQLKTRALLFKTNNIVS